MLLRRENKATRGTHPPGDAPISVSWYVGASAAAWTIVMGVSAPLAPLYAAGPDETAYSLLGNAVVWGLGLVGIVLGGSRLNEQVALRFAAEQDLRRSRDELETVVARRTADLRSANAQLRREIVDRKRAEDTFRQSEQRYRQLLEAVTTYVYTVKLESGVPVSTRHGLGCLAATGYTPEEFASDPNLWLSMVHADDRARASERVAAVQAGSDVPPIEHRIVHKDGTVRWVRDTLVRHHNEAGVFVRYDGLVEDITERKRAEEALQEAKAFSDIIIASLPNPFYMLDRQGRFMRVNRALQEVTGLSFEQLRQADLPSVICEEDRPRVAGAIAEVFQRGYAEAEAGVPAKDGTPRTFLLTGKRMDGEEGAFLIGIGIDLTEQRKAADVLRKNAEELRQAHKMEAVGQLAGGIAHEFNNLLQAIGGYANCAMEGLSPQEQRYQDLREILKAADRAAALTRQLLGFSRRHVLRPADLDPNQVVADLAKMLRPIIGEHISLEMALAGDAGTVHADPGELQQALLNLCLNARDAMPNGGALQLKTRIVTLSEPSWDPRFQIEPGRYVVFTITDTGCGMSAEVQRHLFEPFFTTKEVGKGTGLGLPMVYGVVQQHKGAIHVYSEPGRGTTFKVYLPVGGQESEDDLPEAPAAAPGGRETILVAEDEAIVRDIVVRILESSGYQVLTARNGEEALRVFEKHHAAISLVLLDVIMPKLTGYEVYRRIASEHPGAKVIFVSGYDPGTNQSKFILQEDLRLIEKPFDPGTLLCAVREALDEEQVGRFAAAPGLR